MFTAILKKHREDTGNGERTLKGQGRMSGNAPPRKRCCFRDLKDKPESAGERASGQEKKQERVWSIQGQSGSEPDAESGGSKWRR